MRGESVSTRLAEALGDDPAIASLDFTDAVASVRAARHGADGYADLRALWLGPSLLGIAAGVLRPAGAAGLVTLAAFDRLIRAALTAAPDLAGTSDILMTLFDGSGLKIRRIDLALARLDLETGVCETFAHGRATTRTDAEAAGNGPGRRRALDPGGCLWLSTSPLSPPRGPDLPAADWVTGQLPGEGQAGAIVGLSWRAPKPAGGLRLRVPDGLNAPHDLAAAVASYLGRAGAGDRLIRRLALALTELLPQAIRWSYRQGGARELLLTLTTRADRLTVDLADDGLAFDPTGLPMPDLKGDIAPGTDAGLGLRLLDLVAESLTYRREAGWNRLVAVCRLD